MKESFMRFYYSKITIIMLIIISLLFIIFSICVMYLGIIDQAFIVVPIALLLFGLFTYLFGVNVLALIRNPPYIIFTETFIQLGKKGLKIDYNQIDSLYISQGVFTLDIEIVVSNQNKIYDIVAFSNESMLGSIDRFKIKYDLIPTSKRPNIFKVLDFMIDFKEDYTSHSFSLSKLIHPSFLSQHEFLDKYDYNPPV